MNVLEEPLEDANVAVHKNINVVVRARRLMPSEKKAVVEEKCFVRGQGGDEGGRGFACSSIIGGGGITPAVG